MDSSDDNEDSDDDVALAAPIRPPAAKALPLIGGGPRKGAAAAFATHRPNLSPLRPAAPGGAYRRAVVCPPAARPACQR